MRVAIRVVTIVAVAAILVPFVPRGPEPAAAQPPANFDVLLGRPTNSSITVNLTAASSATWRVQYGTDQNVAPTDPTTSSSNVSAGSASEITLDGLSANTRYHYRIQFLAGSNWVNDPGGVGTFHTQRAAGSSFTFVMQSDAHIVGGPTTSDTVFNQAIANMVADEPDFLIDLGDMFMVTSDNGTTRTRNRTMRTFLDPLSRNAAVYLAIGNHENEEGWWRSGSSSTDIQPYWSINGRKEFFANPVPGGIYSGDGSTWDGVSGDGRRETYYAWEWGDALFVVLDPFWYTTTRPHDNTAGVDPVTTPVSNDPGDWTLGSTQISWLQSTLSGSSKPHKFVFTHHLTGGAPTSDPFAFGYGRGGALAVDNGYEWGDTIQPMLVANGVDAVFHGHDHCYAREVRGGIVYQEVPMPSASGIGTQFCPSNYEGTPIPNSGHISVLVRPDVAAVSYVRSNPNGTTSAVYGIDPGSGAILPNIPPIADAGPDQSFTDTDGNGSQTVVLDGSGSSDLDGSIASYQWREGSTVLGNGATSTVALGLGVHDITLLVVDDEGQTATDTVTVSVIAPPTADAGADQTVLDADDDGLHRVTLDGTDSTTPPGSTITAYSWSRNGTQFATSASPKVDLPLGTHVITLAITNSWGLTDTDTVTVKVNSPPIMPEPANRWLTVQAHAGNHVALGGFANGTGNVKVTFTDPGGGPVCPGYFTQNGGGNPGCDLQPGWSILARGPDDATAEVDIYDVAIVDLDAAADTVTVEVAAHPDLTFGCGGSVAVAYGADVDDGAFATHMIPGPGRQVIDFSEPGPCPGGFDNPTVNLVNAAKVYLTAWDSDGDRALDVRPVEAPFECPTGATPFGDVPPTSFAYDDIRCIYGLDLTTGTSPETFSPHDYVTREQMAAFLARVARLLGITLNPSSHPFADVPASSYAYRDVALIYELGVTTGTSPTTYSPDDLVTREQMAAFLARLYAVLHGTPSSPVLAWVASTPFSDVPGSSFARDDIGRIYGLEVTMGTSASTYSPRNYVTREQMAAFLARLIRVLELV